MAAFVNGFTSVHFLFRPFIFHRLFNKTRPKVWVAVSKIGARTIENPGNEIA